MLTWHLCVLGAAGLLKVREQERIGAGPAGFMQIQQHPFFDGVDWEGTLRREVPAPWVPPPSEGGAAEGGVDFAREDVMIDRPYDTERWAETFVEFGPVRNAPWPGDC